MKRASYKKDFQSWKGIMALKLLCCNIVAGRFDWKKYCTPQSYWVVMKVIILMISKWLLHVVISTI